MPAVYGYVAGGFTSGGSAASARTATTDRITFATGIAAASTISDLTQARGRVAGISDVDAYGYFSGGNSGSSANTTDRITFTTSATASATASNLSAARDSAIGITDGVTYGYMTGGQNSSSFLSSTDRLEFSTGTYASNGPSSLSVQRWFLAGISDGTTYGYAVGGVDNNYTEMSSTDRIVFSTSVTSAATVSALNSARGYGVGLSDAVTYGYVMGGSEDVNYPASERITFSTGIFAVSTASNITPNTYYITSSTSDGVLYGYASGGTTGAVVSTTHRITYSTGVTAAYTVANLSQARSAAAGISDAAV